MTASKPQAPQRYLPPHIADAIRQSKIDSRMSWRQLAVEVGRSHSFLVQIAGGKRVPSRFTAQRLIDALRLDGETAAELLEVAAPPWRERQEGGSHVVHPDRMATNGVSDRPHHYWG